MDFEFAFHALPLILGKPFEETCCFFAFFLFCISEIEIKIEIKINSDMNPSGYGGGEGILGPSETDFHLRGVHKSEIEILFLVLKVSGEFSVNVHKRMHKRHLCVSQVYRKRLVVFRLETTVIFLGKKILGKQRTGFSRGDLHGVKRRGDILVVVVNNLGENRSETPISQS